MDARTPAAPAPSPPDFDRTLFVATSLLAVYGAVMVGAGFLGVSLALGDFGWLTDEPRLFDRYFTVLLAVLAVLLVHNLVLLGQTGERLHFLYCVYVVCIALHLVLYEQLLSTAGIDMPFPSDVTAGLAFNYIGLVWLCQFTRQLLGLGGAGPRTDRFLRYGAGLGVAVALVVYFAPSVFYLADFAWMGAFGTAMLVLTARQGVRGDPAAAVFSLSWLANVVAYWASYSAFVWPDAFASWLPAYRDHPLTMVDAIWNTGLTLEAFLMSLSIGIHARRARESSRRAAALAERYRSEAHSAHARLGALVPRPAPGERTTETNGARPSFVERVREAVEAHVADPGLGVEFLARVTATSPSTLRRRLKRELGMSPSGFVRRVRMETARALLDSGRVRTVGEAAAAVGYASAGHFSRHFRDAFGESPRDALANSRIGEPGA